MATAKELKKRISTVKSTQQTTKAMKMVSAAKLRRAQIAITANRPYAKQIDSMMKLVSSIGDLCLRSKLIKNAESENRPNSEKTVLLVLVTSDRGLCGGFNAQIQKAGMRWYQENKSNYNEIKLAFIGRKGFEYFKRRNHEALQYDEFGRNINFNSAKKFSDWMVKSFLVGKFDEVRFVYNEFKNAISQEVIVEQFLPVGEEILENQSVEEKNWAENDLYLVKPSAQALFDDLLEKHFAIQVYRVLLESQASEHGSRMSSMENATKNAGEMIQKLTLAYNKQRQAGITSELLEIIAGSESQG